RITGEIQRGFGIDAAAHIVYDDVAALPFLDVVVHEAQLQLGASQQLVQRDLHLGADREHLVVVQHPEPRLILDLVDRRQGEGLQELLIDADQQRDRKSTRLNSSHVKISYAVFCLKKKKTN